MVFKLVRTDSEEPCKIQLCIGKHVIGRGKFLDCDDKRVSRNHGELEVMEDTVNVKALHQNPCFIIRKESEETIILAQNCSSSISNGDRFGLLPHSYWYELMHCTVADVDQQPAIGVAEANDDVDSVTTQPFESEKDDSPEMNFNLNETVVNDENPGSPSLLPTETNDVADATATVTGADDKADGEQSPIKRTHSLEDSEASSIIKRIKTEDEDKPAVKQEPDSVQDSSNAAPVSNQLNDQAGPSNTNNADKDAANAPIQPANPLPRERCMYGANCYRRNPQHKTQFSHPSDADWGAGARGVCPYGASCRRRDPRHWRDHTHPPGTQPPTAGNKKKRQTKKRSESDDDDDDDLEYKSDNDEDVDFGNIQPVLKKRPRKIYTANYNWDDLDSSHEEDPYGTDDDDTEWQPSESQ